MRRAQVGFNATICGPNALSLSLSLSLSSRFFLLTDTTVAAMSELMRRFECNACQTFNANNLGRRVSRGVACSLAPSLSFSLPLSLLRFQSPSK